MINLPLMQNNISKMDLEKVIQHLQSDDPILTQSKNVALFEEEWSKWLGVKYSVFVNSGSSANLLTIFALKQKYPEGGEVIVPPLTWSSDIFSVLIAGFKPVFVDIDPLHLGMHDQGIINALNENTRAVFLTHAQGFSALSDKLLNALEEKDIHLIEDVCESHGAKHNGKKLGSFGWVSNFSFYYAHHLSTIEGGMICTNDEKLYQTFRMLRSHGMVRESTCSETKSQYQNDHPDLNPDFIFAFPSFNVRNTEIGAIIGRNQLKRLDENNLLRTKNLETFLENLDSKKFRTDFKTEGSSNYAFNLILNEADDQLVERVMNRMRQEKIEFRRGSAGGGNQLRQPYLRKNIEQKFKDFPNVDHVHFYGFYIGNFPSLETEKVLQLCSALNDA
ncbi:DegT/DnrJ/EryC1/StrS aminotransferase family protein [Opitutales bacterium]|nr:DegT/DnrJ/EryC1/StrS aminotransferase family protein [Opitutales bacterium]